MGEAFGWPILPVDAVGYSILVLIPYYTTDCGISAEFQECFGSAIAPVLKGQGETHKPKKTEND